MCCNNIIRGPHLLGCVLSEKKAILPSVVLPPHYESLLDHEESLSYLAIP